MTYSCIAVTNSPPGTYPIVPSLNDPNHRLGNYSLTVTNGTLTVLQAGAVLTWATPSAIPYGTALSSNQLNALASVGGSFVYNPTNGAVLNAGTNLLAAVFTPSDPGNYSGASVNVNLVVLRAALSVTANSATRLEDQANPVFTGTITGLTNGDNITATYTSIATESSSAGTYPIVANLQDPDGRLSNYTVTAISGALTVNATNDLFAYRKPIGGTSNTVYSSNVNAHKEPGEPDHCGNPGGDSLWWTWTAPAQGLVTLSTVGSSFETLLAVYTGDSVSNLTQIATNIDGGGDHTSLLTFEAAANGTYQIAVDGFSDGTNAAAGSIVLNLSEDYGTPQFVVQPQGLTVPVGAGVTFTASVRGSQPTSYQWRRNGVDLPGATDAQYYTNTFYAIASAQTNGSGSYTVAASNSFSSDWTISSPAVMNVFTRPPNDDYTNAFVLSGVTNTAQGNNTYATPDCSGTGCFEPALFAGHSVWWTWTAPTNGTVVVDTIGSAFDTVLALYTNDVSGSNVLVAYDDQSGGNNTSRLQFDTAANITYHFGVDGSRWAPANATTGGIVLNLKVQFPPPQITLQPQPQSAEVGWSLAFNVAATGTTPLSYQWSKDGSPLPGATASSYAIGTVQASDGGNYSVMVSNAFGTGTSSNAALTVFPVPANDAFANRTVLPSLQTNTVYGLNVGATKEPGELNHAGNSGGRSVWWSWTAPTNGTAVISTIGSSFDTLLAIYTGNSVSSLALVAADDNGGGNLTSRAAFSAVAGTTYQIAVDGYNPSGPHGAAYGNIVLNFQQSAVFAPLVLTQPQSQAVASGGSVTFSVTAAGTPAPVYQWLTNGVPVAGQTNATLQLKNVGTNQAGVYSVLLSNIAGVVVSAPATLRVEKALNPSFRGDWPGFETGDAMDVTVADGLAYVATSAGFLVLDVGDPANPRRVGGYNTDSPATRIAAQDGFVYLLASSNQLGGATLSRFDVRNPGLPRKVAEYAPVSSAMSDFALADDLLCAVDGQSLLVLNSTNCSLRGRLDTSNGIATGVVVSNGLAYVTWPAFVGVYSLANPTPVQSTTLVQSSAELALANGYLYALTGGQQVVQLRVLDPTNPVRPQVGLSSLSNVLGHADEQALAVSSNAVFVVTAGYDGNALGVYTPLGQPWNPTLLSATFFADGTPHRVAADESHVYVANGGAGLKVFDVSDPAHAVPTNQFYTALQANAVVLQGNNAYVLDSNTGFHVLDVSDPTTPVSVGDYQSPDGAAAIAVKSHYVYLALNAPPTSISISGPSLEVVDVGNPGAPRLLGSVSLPGPTLTRLPQPGDPSVQVTALAVSGNLALVGSQLNGAATIGIVDVSNPASPLVVGRFNLPGTAQIANIDFQGRYAYVADADFGLRVLDLADPANPVQAATFAEASATTSVSVQGNLCLLTGAFGTDLLDVTQPGSPIRLGNNNITGTLTWLQAPLALGYGPNGIQVFDLVNFTSPLQIGQFAGSYSQVTVQGRYAFAAADEAGLTVLDIGASFGTPPSILDSPTNLRVVAGASTNLFVAAGGTVPLSYQWLFNGSGIPGATDPMLMLPGVQSTDAGQYSVQVANALGAATSAVAILSVDLPPSVTLTSPSDQEVLTPPATIPLVAVAAASSTNDTITQVAFYNGANLLGTVTAPPFSLTMTDVLTGTYVISAVATDNEGATSTSSPATAIVTNLPVFQFSSAGYTAYESNGVVSVTVQRSSGASAASVGFQTLDFSAVAVGNGGIGNYYGVSNQIAFAAGQTAVQVPIQLVNDLVYRGLPVFHVVLFNPSAGWSLAAPSDATVSIVDDDLPSSTNSFTDVLPAAPPPTGRGALTLSLEPPSAAGCWRFPWETAWRLSGSTATNLPPGNYPVVFEPRAGWLAPPGQTYTVSGNASEADTNFYAFVGGAATGSLGFTLHPSAVVGLAQWRPVENPPGPWLDSGDVLTNLPPGEIVVEFSDVDGYSTPASEFVQVSSGQTTIYPATYYLASPAPGEPPRPLPNLSAVVNTNTPYQFSGQLLTDVGYSSGFVVKDRTVLTAAHAVFDPLALAYVTNAWWFFQEEAGEYEPVPQIPNGWYVFEGYAAARAADVQGGQIGPDESSTPTRQQDVAALYFFESAGRGGYGGYLASDPAGTQWLLSDSLMLLIGYPVETVPVSDRGRLHQVGPGYYLFNQIPDTSLFTSTDLQSYPGNSGGPLCVQTADSLGVPFFLPAGVYLGGSGETIVRSIDLDVVDLINRADILSHGGVNSTGGGVVTITVGQGGGIPATIQVTLAPATAVAAGAAWRVQGGDPTWITNPNYQQAVPPGTSVTLEFRPLDGWDLPPDQNLTLTPGQHILSFSYTLSARLGVRPASGLTSSGFAGGPFSPTAVTYALTNAGAASLNWLAVKTASWLSLLASSGTLAAGATTNVTLSLNANANSLAAGTYSDTVSFTNLTTGLGSTNLPVTLTVAGQSLAQFTALRLLTNGAVAMTLQGVTGGVYSIIASTNLLTPLTNWTEVRRLTNSGGQTVFTNPPPTVSPQYYRAKQL